MLGLGVRRDGSVWVSHLPCHPQMEIQREKDRVVELTNETKKFKALKKV